MGSGQSKNETKALVISAATTTNDDDQHVKTCGSSSSKKVVKIPTWMIDVGTHIKVNVEEDVQRRGMLQREIQMSINIAKARDTIQIFGTIYSVGVMSVTGAKLAGKAVPSIVGIPIVVGGILLGNMADMAYGNKLQRVTKEAQYIMEHERYRFIPPAQAPFYKYYSHEDKDLISYIPPVGTLFPSNLVARSHTNKSTTHEKSP